MRKHWLRGILLGASLALLLTGGVALAQGIAITIDPQGCIECSTESDLHWLSLHSSGWLENEHITFVLSHEGDFVYACKSCGQAVNGEFNISPQWWVFACPGHDVTPGAFEVSAQQLDQLGTWRFRLVGVESEREGFFTIDVAEDCEEEAVEEFVPEPGTLALLGSGLAGLAGYATLRWRFRN
jgi:hypothetical protein